MEGGARQVFRAFDTQIAVGHDPLGELGNRNAVDVFHPGPGARAVLLKIAAQHDVGPIVGQSQARLLE
ncbi:hypothetical protein D3C81_1760300 [compost metagenome]